MKIGISTASLQKMAETEDALELIRQSGADCCEAYLQTFYEYRPEFSKRIAPAICGFDVHSVRVLAGNFEPQLFFENRRSRGDGFYWLDQVLRLCQQLGAKNYTFNGAAYGGGKTDFDKIAERLNAITGFCAHYGVTVCLENDGQALYNRPGVFGELKRRCPQLCAAFNLEKARRSGYPYSMYLKDMSGAISHIYLSDKDENGKTCLPGQGVYSFEEIFKRLFGGGFDGAAIVAADGVEDLKDLKNSLEFLKEIVYKLN